MSCCPEATFTFLDNGLQVNERNLQSESVVQLFFPYRAIQAARLFMNRRERDAQLQIWISGQGTPGAGGLGFRWALCVDGAQATYDQLIVKI